MSSLIVSGLDCFTRTRESLWSVNVYFTVCGYRNGKKRKEGAQQPLDNPEPAI